MCLGVWIHWLTASKQLGINCNTAQSCLEPCCFRRRRHRVDSFRPTLAQALRITRRGERVAFVPRCRRLYRAVRQQP